MDKLLVLSFSTPFYVYSICTFNALIIVLCPNPALLMGGARGVMVIVIGNGLSDLSSNPGRD